MHACTLRVGINYRLTNINNYSRLATKFCDEQRAAALLNPRREPYTWTCGDSLATN